MYRIFIQIESGQAFVPTAQKIKRWVKAALGHKIRQGELTIRLVGKKEIQALNKRYRHKNKPTNVLSFRAEVPKAVKLKLPLLGDLVICSAIVNEEAHKRKKTQEAHWAHIVMHGCLHLLGYDHERKIEAEKMEKKEIRLLNSFGFSNPYS